MSDIAIAAGYENTADFPDLVDAVTGLSALTGKTYTSVNIVGGGCQDMYLNQLTAHLMSHAALCLGLMQQQKLKPRMAVTASMRGLQSLLYFPITKKLLWSKS